LLFKFGLKVKKKIEFEFVQIKKQVEFDLFSQLAPPNVLFSNQLKEDLNRLVDLQSFIDVSIEVQPQNNHKIFNGFVANIDLNQ
jgi:hypothetical protein